MRNNLIAAVMAVATTGTAFAQSNVTVYGIVDVDYEHMSASGKQSVSAINNGAWLPSRLGFRGTEDLGNGLKTLFTLEYNIAPDQNSGIGDSASTNQWTSSQSRQAYVGLSGSFGTVLVGRLQTTAYDFSCTYNNLAGGGFNVTERLAATNTKLFCGNPSRADNAFGYVSPDLNGFRIAYNHARITENANGNNNPTTTTVTPYPTGSGTYYTAASTGADGYLNMVSAKYDNGPLSAMLIYSKQNLAQTAADDDVTEWGIGANYDFQVAKLFFMYRTQKTNGLYTDVAGVKWNSPTDKALSLGVDVPVTTADLLRFALAGNKRDATDAQSRAWGIAWGHSLSKRTTLYTGYTRVSNDDNAAQSLTFSPKASMPLTAPTWNGTATVRNDGGASTSIFIAGINHKF